MAINAGSTALAADFVNTSAGAGDANKGVKLDSGGKINPNMAKKFGCRVINASSTISNGGLSTMSFPAEDFDDDNMHSNVSNTSRITFNTAGYYIVGGSVWRGGVSSSAPLGCAIVLNGTTQIGNGGGSLMAGGCGAQTMRHFAVGDYVELQACSPGDSGPGPGASGDEKTNFWALMVQKD